MDGELATEFDRACQAVASGRRASAWLARRGAKCSLSEPQLRLLWQLLRTADRQRLATSGGVDQKTLANDLRISPGLVSRLVEELRLRKFIAAQSCDRDRRRQRWQLTNAGHAIIVALRAARTEDIADVAPVIPSGWEDAA